MKISWKPTDGGMKELVYAHEELIGYVEKKWSTQKWKIVPYFNLVANFTADLDVTHRSSYDAGKKLHEMWEREQLYHLQLNESVDDDFEQPYWEDEDDPWDPRVTQPIDMSKVWSKP